MELLRWLSLALAASLASSERIVELQSPRVTNWGFWHNWVNCPKGEYAAGIMIKTDRDGKGDNTGLNGVAVYCLPINWSEFEFERRATLIMGSGGFWGEWQAVKWCPRGQVIVGFQLRSQADQGSGDDVAADNFSAFCGSPFDQPADNTVIMGDSAGYGEWTAKQFCPPAYAVCAIKVQIEAPQRGDNTAVNNVDLRCCKVDYSCEADAELTTLKSFDNTNGSGDMQYTYTVHTSFTKTTSSSETMSSNEKKMIASKISAELGFTGSGLTAKLAGELSINLEHGYARSLQTMVQETSEHSTEEKIVVNIPKGAKAVLKQLHFTCGGYRMAIAKTINQQID